MDQFTKISDLTVHEFQTLLRQSLPIRKINTSDAIGIEEVAEMTGYEKSTIYALCHKKQIPFFKNSSGGRKLQFSRAKIEEWTLSKQVRTREEIAEYDLHQLGKYFKKSKSKI